MRTRTGILPAGGKALRWQGLPKECLPIHNGMTLLSRSVKVLQKMRCDPVVIVTTPEREAVLRYVLGDWEGVEYTYNDQGLFLSCLEACSYAPNDEYVMIMPDTIFNGPVFPYPLDQLFYMGMFDTNHPERVGTLRDGQIVDKVPSTQLERAWGTLAWQDQVTQFWLKRADVDQNIAFTAAIKSFGIEEVPITSYSDMASFEDYVRYLQNV